MHRVSGRQAKSALKLNDYSVDALGHCSEPVDFVSRLEADR